RGGARAIALGSSLVVHLFCFMALFLALAEIMALADAAPSPALVSYWSFIALLGLSVTLVLYYLVCASITFTGPGAAGTSVALGAAAAAVWADIARLRTCPTSDAPQAEPIDALDLFAAPLCGRQGRIAAG